MSAPIRRKHVAHAKGGVSLRRACALIGTARSGLGYVSKLDAKDAPILTEMRKLTELYPRYGHRRIRVFFRRQGIEVSHDRTYLSSVAKGEAPGAQETPEEANCERSDTTHP